MPQSAARPNPLLVGVFKKGYTNQYGEPPSSISGPWQKNKRSVLRVLRPLHQACLFPAQSHFAAGAQPFP